MRRHLHYIYRNQETGGEPGAGAGGGTPSDTPWTAALPEDLREHPSLKDFKDPGGLAKAYIDTKKMVGGMLRIPSDDAGEEDIRAFRQKLLDNPTVGVIPRPDPTDPESMESLYRALGAPETPDQYEAPEGLPEDRAKLIAGLAHQAGVNQKQFETVLGGILEADNAVMQEQEEQRTQGIEQLKGEWGDAYISKTKRAEALAQNTGAPEALSEAIKSGKVNAETLRWLDKIAVSIGQEGAQLATQIGGQEGETTQELVERRDELTRKMQTERMPQAEYQRNLDKLVSMNQKLASLTR